MRGAQKMRALARRYKSPHPRLTGLDKIADLPRPETHSRYNSYRDNVPADFSTLRFAGSFVVDDVVSDDACNDMPSKKPAHDE